MFYLCAFFILVTIIVIQIEKKIISSKYLIKKAHEYRHRTRKERIEKRREIDEYKKSLTHKHYLDHNLKDPTIKKMLNEIRYKNLDALRFEARLFYYGFLVSILFGSVFSISGFYKDEFISSLYPYIQPYFKIIYSNFDKYTFNPEAFKVCFSWIFAFSVIFCFCYLIYILKFPRNSIFKIKKELINYSEKFKYLLSFSLGTWILTLWLNDSTVGYYQQYLFYSLPSHGGYFIYFVSIFFGIMVIFITLKKTVLDLFKRSF